MTGDSVRAALSQLGDVLESLRERLGDEPGPRSASPTGTRTPSTSSRRSCPSLRSGCRPASCSGWRWIVSPGCWPRTGRCSSSWTTRPGGSCPARAAASGATTWRASMLDPGEGLIGRVFAEKRVLTYDAAARAIRPRSVRRALPDAAGHRGAGADRGRGRRGALRGPSGSRRSLHHHRRAPAPGHRRPRRLLARPPAAARAPGRSPRAPAGAARRWSTRTSPRGSRARSWPASCDAACRLAGVRGALALAGSAASGVTRCSRARGCWPASGSSGLRADDELLVDGFAADGPVAIRDLQARRPGRGPACSRRRESARPCSCRCARAAAWWGSSAWPTRSRGTSRRRKRSPR